MPDTSWSQVTDELRAHADLYERERRGEDVDMPRRLRPCICGCGQQTRSEFATGHHASYRTRLLSNAATGDELAQRELEIRGWLPEQGWSNFGTAVGASDRNENRASRRAQVRRAQVEIRALHAQQRTRPGMRMTVTPVAQTGPIAAHDRSFGVEIEFVGASQQAVAQALRTAGLDCRVMNYTHDVVTWWKIVGDASLRGGSYSDTNTGELVSPPLQGEAGFAELKLACQALAAAGASVNRSCGLHVHHEVREFNMPHFRRAIRLYSEASGIINLLLAPSRRNNSYCTQYDQHDLVYLDSENSLSRFAAHAGRYRAFNVVSFQRYGTVEFRQHHGTTDYRKIRAWVRFGQALLNHALTWQDGQTVPPTDDLEGFLRGIGVRRQTVSYLLTRAREFEAQVTRRAERRQQRTGTRRI